MFFNWNSVQIEITKAAVTKLWAAGCRLKLQKKDDRMEEKEIIYVSLEMYL